jgi:wobble nucleotide-excising tRNase
MSKIQRVRSLKGVGILANKAAKDPGFEFLKVNLIYGFNGSGKSTLSRVFSSLQKGIAHAELPDECAFEIELDDGAIYGAPNKVTGLENRICVFNTDFMAENLQWDKGTASSIFYLSQEQAELVEQLKTVEMALPAKAAVFSGAANTAKASAKTFSTYCTERAKTVHSARRLGTRKYESPKLKADYASEIFNASSIKSAIDLAALQAVVTQTAPPPPLDPIALDLNGIRKAIIEAIAFSEVSLGAVILKELEDHPAMVPWVKTGHEYHAQTGLERCLLCQNLLTEERKDQLAAALNDKLTNLISEVAEAKDRAEALRAAPGFNPQTLPKPAEFEPSLRTNSVTCRAALEVSAQKISALLGLAIAALAQRAAQPTQVVAHGLPTVAEIDGAIAELTGALTALNGLIDEHTAAGENFAKRQDEGSLAILRHFLAEGHEQFSALKTTADLDAKAEETAAAEVQALEQQIAELKAKVRAHGPAAPKITKLVHDYLGHKELTIEAAEAGYTLKRNGKPVKGQPSEGEKTAIALCYFLTTLESDGRALKDLIVVVDDPISSLDTRAMNYACALVLKKLEKAAQLFVLTHNQHCMNEFKKAWKSAAYPKKETTAPTGRLLYMDVRLPEGSATRSATVVEMSALLREYDSEYHFLCHKILEFEASGTEHSLNLLLMPNAMRRVLEIFLAFKVPGTEPIGDKLKKMADRHTELDPVRLVALERLSQVESHSDNLDDLTGHSPMIVEEVRQTCAALLELMAVADESHTKAIRKQCKAA